MTVPAGTSTLCLIHRNKVDGLVSRVFAGHGPPPDLPMAGKPAEAGK